MKKTIKKYKNILIIIAIILIMSLYLIFSYFGLFIFTLGFNEFDFVILNVIGDSVLVGIVTYVATKSISLYISKKEFYRNTKVNVYILEKNNSIYNFITFMDKYNNSNSYFGLLPEDRKVLDYVYEKYHVFSSVLNRQYINDQLLENVMNYPFIRNYLFNEKEKKDFKDNWESMCKSLSIGKTKGNIRLFQSLLKEEDYKYFERFSNIICKMKFFEIVNLNSNEGCILLVTANNQVINKISCLPNTSYGIYLYFDNNNWIQFTGFTYDYDGKEEATSLVGFKYTNKVEETIPANITLSDYIKVNKD